MALKEILVDECIKDLGSHMASLRLCYLELGGATGAIMDYPGLDEHDRWQTRILYACTDLHRMEELAERIPSVYDDLTVLWDKQETPNQKHSGLYLLMKKHYKELGESVATLRKRPDEQTRKQDVAHDALVDGYRNIVSILMCARVYDGLVTLKERHVRFIEKHPQWLVDGTI